MKNSLQAFGAVCMILAALLLIRCSPPSEDQVVNPLLAEQYFTFSINGLPGSVTSSDTIGARRDGDITTLYGSKSGGHPILYSRFSGDATTGTFPIHYMRLFVNSKYYVSTSTPLQVFVTAYGNAGDYISGSYSGAMKDSIGTQTYNINGVFKVKRLQ